MNLKNGSKGNYIKPNKKTERCETPLLFEVRLSPKKFHLSFFSHIDL